MIPPIDLLSLYVFFSQLRLREVTLKDRFFEVSRYARAHDLGEDKRKIPLRAPRGLNWENKTYNLKRSILQSYHLTFYEINTS